MSDRWELFDQYRETTFDRLGYEPAPGAEKFHCARNRVRLVAGGERGGKSYSSALDGFARQLFTVDMKPGRYWIVGPDYVQTRQEFEYLYQCWKDMGVPIAKASMPVGASASWMMQSNGGIVWQTRTSADVKKLASEAVDGIIMSEAAQQTYDAYLKCRGRVAERRGWLILSGTFEQGLPWYADLWEEWQGGAKAGESFSLPTWENTAIFPLGENDPEILDLKATYPHDLFMERFGGVPSKPWGLVFKEFTSSVHVVEMELEDSPVYLAIDPGYTGAYSVLAIQVAGPFVHVVDEVYVRYGTAKEVIARCKDKPWWRLVPKISDGKTGGVIDVAGRQHQGMESHVEIWVSREQDGGAGVALRSNPVSIEDGVLVVREVLGNPERDGEHPYKEPRIFFSSELNAARDKEGHPQGVLGEFRMYQYPRRLQGQSTTDKPIDKYNHALKALGYWLYDHFGPVGGRAPLPGQKERKGWR